MEYLLRGDDMNREDKIYDHLYGNIPNDQMGRIKHILGKRFDNEKFNKYVESEARKIKRIKWKKLNFTMWKVVKPSPRPRFSRRGRYTRAYVPGAREAGDWFSQFAEENDLPFIDTPCKLNMKIYSKTPTGFNMKNKLLAELGIIRPWKNTGDFDNYAKGIADAIQHGMLANDCLVIESTQELFYSIKPHAEIEIIYMEKWPEYESVSKNKYRIRKD